MVWEVGARYALPEGEDSEWFATALAELRGRVAGPITIRLVFRRDGDSRLHTIAGDVTDGPVGRVAVRSAEAKLTMVPVEDLVYFKPLKGAGLPPTRYRP